MSAKKVDPAAAARDAVIAAIRKSFGKHSVGLLGEGGESEVEEVIQTGITVLDHYVFGCGGLPAGRMVEVYSDEGGGKTSFGWAAIEGALAQGYVAILCETEDALNLERAETFGVDLDKVVLLEPDHMEDALAKQVTALEALSGKQPALLVWDSIASCPTKAEVLDGLSGKDAWDGRAKILSQACRVLSKLAKAKKCCLLFVNQTRMKVGVMFGDPCTTPGGKAVKFHSSIRLQLWPGKHLKNRGDEAVGQIITFKAIKNRCAFPFRKARVRLDFGHGWNDYWSTLEHAKEAGIISGEATREVEKMAEPARAEARLALLAKAIDALDARAWSKEPVTKSEESAEVSEESDESKE
jgi:recombination protein RecA